MINHLRAILALFLCLFAFQSNALAETRPPNATLVILLTKSASEDETTEVTSRFLYIRNDKGDKLSAYKSEEGVFEGQTYSLISDKSDDVLVIHPLQKTQDTDKKLSIHFSDGDHSVTVNQTDRYVLYPAYYTQLKTNVQQKHSVVSLLSLLQDTIGDYSFDDLSPFLLLPAGQDHQQTIQQAHIVTQRSQADEITDKWDVAFVYNAKGELASVKAASGDEVRFKKSITYQDDRISTVETYRNLESRHITERTTRYKNGLPLKAEENVVETGKNRETDISTLYTIKTLPFVDNTDLSKEKLSQLFATP